MSQSSTLFIGHSRLEFPELDSTNTRAMQMAGDHPPEGTLILAHKQSAGRGQAGNVWFSAPGDNLSFSMILYPSTLTGENIFLLNQMVSLALIQTLRSFLPDEILHIKWPNDILLREKKVAGILIENIWKDKKLHTCIAGIGLNVNNESFPPELEGKAVSMYQTCGQKFSFTQILDVFCKNLEAFYLQIRAGRYAYVQQSYLGALWRYQEWATFRLGETLGAGPDFPDEKKKFPGMIIGVQAGGKLAIQLENNQVLYFDLKEIVFC